MSLSIKSNAFDNIQFHKATGKENESFVGIKIKGNDVYFYYPEAYDLDLNSKSLRNDVISILRTISIAKTSSKDRNELYTGRENLTEFALDSYLWVIFDYMKNGYYVNKEKIYQANHKGKINWKRTLDTNPIISKKKQIIYNDIIAETSSSTDNIIVEIHKYCLKKSIDSIGWLFNLNSNFIKVGKMTEHLKTMYLVTLKKELSHTFDDSKKMRLKRFLDVLQGLDAKIEDRDFVYGVDSYYYVFEKMIDKIFGNRDVKEFYPKGKWYLTSNEFKPKDGSDLRPDTILVNEIDGKKNAYILDSKYYRYGTTGDENDLPGTSSIQKQISYGDFVKNSKKDEHFDNIYNAFLLPFNKSEEIFKSNENMVYIGFAKTDTNDNRFKHEVVHSFLIDLKHVIDTWNHIYHEEDVKVLVEEIEKGSLKAFEVLKDID